MSAYTSTSSSACVILRETPRRLGLVRRVLCTLVACSAAAWATAQDSASAAVKPVYRCPGPPVLYTDGLTVQEAKDQGCRIIEGAAVSVVQLPARPRPGAVPAGTTNGNPGATSARGGETRVDPAAQRARDTDARRILAEELKREEDRLAVMQREFNGGEPERRGDERNFAKYQERVAEMRAAVARKEADVAALKRELAKLPP